MGAKTIFAKKLTPQAIIIILLASSFYLYEFYLQVAPGVMQHELMRDLAIDATQLGLMSGSFYFSYTVLQLPAGLLLDRYSTKSLLTWGSAIFSLGVFLFAYAPNVYLAAGARFIMGGVAAAAFISVLHLIARWVPLTYFGLFTGIAEMMGALGGYGGTEQIALLLKHCSWRTASKGFAYIGLLLTLLLMFIIRNHPPNTTTILSRCHHHSVWHDLKTIFKNRETWSIGSYSFFIWAPILGFTLWGVEFIRLAQQCDKTTAANIVSFLWLGVACSSPAVGWLSDFIGKRCLLTTLCAVLGLGAMSSIIFWPYSTTTILYLLMFTIGFASAGQTLSFALIKDNNSPLTNSAANGFNNMVVVAGGFLLQPLIGKILDLYWQGSLINGVPLYSIATYQVALSILPLCYLLATLTSIFFIKETHCIASWK